MKKNIFFLGCGKMGNIIARKLIEENIFSPSDFLILKPSLKNIIDNATHITKHLDIPKSYIADIVFICIKPQNSEKILTDFAQLQIFHPNTIFISILAGKTTHFFANIFGDDKKIVRTMPNLAIEVGQGIIPVFFKNFNTQDKKAILEIFSKISLAFEIKDEELFHSLTALYGSGPAYIFLLQEIFEKIALKHQIPENIIHQLTQKLFLGSALLSNKDAENFSELRSKVTSKKGVTESALKKLIKNNKLHNVINKAIDHGVKRSQRLAK